MMEPDELTEGNALAATAEKVPGAVTRPGWVFIAACMAGPSAAGPIAGASLVRAGRKGLGWAVGTISFAVGILLFLLTTLWGIDWYWGAFVLAAAHLVSGILLFLALRRPYRIFRESRRKEEEKRGSHRAIVAGLFGGAALGGIIGPMVMTGYVLSVDLTLSSLLPVTGDDFLALFRVFQGASSSSRRA